MTLEEFCKKGLLEEYSRISGGDDGDMRIDVDFTDKDDFSHPISFIANIFEIDYDDLIDDICDFEKYELEEFEGQVYFVNAGSFVWSNHWEELLNSYYFDFESLMEAVKYEFENFVKGLKNLEDYEYQFASTDKDYDNFLELVLKDLGLF